MFNYLTQNAKNTIGWKTRRRIIVFSVDDYGNVRLASKKARTELDKAGLKVYSRFDAFDSLETREDLYMLFEVLDSVKDVHGRNAVFTVFSNPCNIDFEKIIEEDYRQYHYEILPQTYAKLAADGNKSYEKAWELWKEGISNGFLMPQFHGREHLNIKVFNEKLNKKDKEILTLLRNRSYTGLSNTGYSTINFTAAFDFWDFNENYGFRTIIKDGLDAFENVFGYRSTHFNPPGGREHPVIHGYLNENGISFLDTISIKKEHRGWGKYRIVLNYTGKKNHLNMPYLVRNIIFEPNVDKKMDWVNYTIRQIETAFRWHRPAVISSHRVNFCGNIVEKNRKVGLDALKSLLNGIIKRWPDVEFLSSAELMGIISKS